MTYCLNYYENKLIAVFMLKLKLLHYRNRCTAQSFGKILAPLNLSATFPWTSGEPGLRHSLQRNLGK